MDEPAIESYTERTDILREDGSLTRVSFSLKESLPTSGAGGGEGEGQLWEDRLVERDTNQHRQSDLKPRLLNGKMI